MSPLWRTGEGFAHTAGLRGTGQILAGESGTGTQEEMKPWDCPMKQGQEEMSLGTGECCTEYR